MSSSVYRATDIAAILDIKESTAYKIISRLNEELEKKGCYTVNGRVSKTFFEEKYHTEKAPATTDA